VVCPRLPVASLGLPTVKYVIRTRKNVWVRYRQQHEGLLAQVSIRRGQLLWWPQTIYQQEERYRVNLALTWDGLAAEPWYFADQSCTEARRQSSGTSAVSAVKSYSETSKTNSIWKRCA